MKYISRSGAEREMMLCAASKCRHAHSRASASRRSGDSALRRLTPRRPMLVGWAGLAIGRRKCTRRRAKKPAAPRGRTAPLPYCGLELTAGLRARNAVPGLAVDAEVVVAAIADQLGEHFGARLAVLRGRGGLERADLAVDHDVARTLRRHALGDDLGARLAGLGHGGLPVLEADLPVGEGRQREQAAEGNCDDLTFHVQVPFKWVDQEPRHRRRR